MNSLEMESSNRTAIFEVVLMVFLDLLMVNMRKYKALRELKVAKWKELKDSSWRNLKVAKWKELKVAMRFHLHYLYII
jgi:hypothetical protein